MSIWKVWGFKNVSRTNSISFAHGRDNFVVNSGGKMTEENKDDWADDFIKHIVPLIGGIKKKLEQGEIEADIVCHGVCPKCKKPLAYVISSYNKHTRGNCVTKDCLRWME